MSAQAVATVPAGNREPACAACVRVKVHASDGTHLGAASLEQAGRIVESGLGEMVSGYVRLIPAARRGSANARGLRLDGLRPHDKATRDDPGSVWTFRKEAA